MAVAVEMQVILVIVLPTEVFPDDDISFPSNYHRNDAAAIVSALRADVEGISICGEIGLRKEQQLINNRSFPFWAPPAETRCYVVGNAPREGNAIDHEIEGVTLSDPSTARKSPTFAM
jgi:hypothetical protein